MAFTPQWNRENRLVLIEELQKHPLLWEEEEYGGMQRLEAIEKVRKVVNKTQGDRPFTHRQIGEKMSDLISAYRDLADKMNRDKAAGLEVREPEWEFFPNLKFLGGLNAQVEDELCALAFSQAANQQFINSQASSQEFDSELIPQENNSQAVNQEVNTQTTEPELKSQDMSQSQEQHTPSTLAFFENIEQPASKPEDPKDKKIVVAKGKKKAVVLENVNWTDEDNICLAKEYQKYPKLWRSNPKEYLRTFGNFHIKARYKAMSLLTAAFNKSQNKQYHQQQIKTQLNTLRLQYRKYLKEWESTGTVPTWPIFHYMKVFGSSNGGPLSIPDSEKAPEPPSQNKDEEDLGNTSTNETGGGAKWTFKKNLRLIREYQRHPRLWSPTYTVYSIRHSCGGGVIKRSQEIELITEAINKFESTPFTSSQILQQIRNLRMKYRAHFKTYLVSNKEPDWKLFKHMKFLDDTVGVADPKEVVIKQEHIKENDKSHRTTRESSPKPGAAKRRSSISVQQHEENKENHGPRKQPKISAYLLLPGQGHRTNKRTFSISSSDSNPDDIIFTQAHDDPPPAKRGKLVSLVENEPLSKDISVLNISTGTDIWIDEPAQAEQDKDKNNVDKSYCLRATTKRASMASIQSNHKKIGTSNSIHHSKKPSEKADNRWSRIRELVAATPNNTPEQMTQDLYMVESFLSTNCTVESPDIVYERSSRPVSANTAINASTASESMDDSNARFVEFLADAMKRIAAVQPDRVASVRKIIKDALFAAEFEEDD